MQGVMEEPYLHTCQGEAVARVASLINSKKVGWEGGEGILGVERVEVAEEVKEVGLGFPGGAVVENLPANAGDAGSSPGLGGSHIPRSNSAREPQLLSLRVWSLCSATGGAAIVRGPRTAMKGGPRLPQLEKALAQKRRPNTAIHTYIHTYIKKRM